MTSLSCTAVVGIIILCLMVLGYRIRHPHLQSSELQITNYVYQCCWEGLPLKPNKREEWGTNDPGSHPGNNKIGSTFDYFVTFLPLVLNNFNFSMAPTFLSTMGLPCHPALHGKNGHLWNDDYWHHYQGIFVMVGSGRHLHKLWGISIFFQAVLPLHLVTLIFGVIIQSFILNSIIILSNVCSQLVHAVTRIWKFRYC